MNENDMLRHVLSYPGLFDAIFDGLTQTAQTAVPDTCLLYTSDRRRRVVRSRRSGTDAGVGQEIQLFLFRPSGAALHPWIFLGNL